MGLFYGDTEARRYELRNGVDVEVRFHNGRPMLFRNVNLEISEHNVTVLSSVRENEIIGHTFGREQVESVFVKGLS